MRRLLAIAAAALVAAAPGASRAADLHLLGGIDLFGVNQPGTGSPANLDLGFALRADLRRLGKRFDLRLDYRDRESFLAADSSLGYNSKQSRHQLHNLSLRVNDLFGRLDLTVGRFPVGGGFWLINDGGAATLRLGPLSLQAYGGVRAFTGGRADATFRGHLLPLYGAGAAVDHPVVRASLFFTRTDDLLEFQRGAAEATPASRQTNENFLDAQLLVLPHADVMLAGGLTLGSRYLVTYSSQAGHFTDVPTVDSQPIGSLMAYAVGEWRPQKRLRLSYAFDFQRVRLLVPVQPLNNAIAAAGGSFEDHTLKAGVRIWRALRVGARYRLRFRENTDVIHRFEGQVDAENLLAGFGAFATVGGDVYQVDRIECDPAKPLECKKPRGNLVVTGGLSFLRPWLDARVGVLYTDAIGTGLAFSNHAKQAMDAGPTSELFPLVLGAQRIAYLRLFALWRDFFAGLDAELALDGKQLRTLVQLGYAL